MDKPKPNAKKIVARVIAVLAALYLLLLGGRFAYAMLGGAAGSANYWYDADFFSSSMVRNVATNHIYNSLAADEAGGMEQKEERVAELAAKSAAYDADEARARALIAKKTAVVQAENSSGLAGSRQLMLSIGVRAEEFDALREALSGIGTLTQTSVSSADKTNEYRALLAERENLERRIENYETLKARGGSVQDQLALESKLMEADGQLQQILVSLGEYGGDRSFCTVRFTLLETGRAGVLDIFLESVAWAGMAFAAVAGISLLALLVALLFAALYFFLKKAAPGAARG